MVGTALALAAALHTPLELAPGVRYDPKIPTLKQVLGHDVGEEITSPQAIVQYLTALQQAAPDRTRLIRYAESWEGRPLLVMAVASRERIARLEAIQADLKRLADPRGLAPAGGGRLVRGVPGGGLLLHPVPG